MELFYGKANCSSCHAGALFTDHQFHATGQPQVGPGKAARFQSHSRDLGRFRVTGNIKDKYAFRTPSLRNVELTGPWGHAGAYAPPPTSKKFAGSSPYNLIISIVAIARPAPLTMQPMLPSSFM